MTQPVLNLNAPLVDPATGKLVEPWNSFFQQFTQSGQAVQNITLGASPFSYKANANGSVYVSGGTISNISLIRGRYAPIDITGQKLIPIRIGDTVKVTYAAPPVIKFLGD